MQCSGNGKTLIGPTVSNLSFRSSPPLKRVNLFVIGVNKAGTSWLYYLLSKHPNIYMSDVKELYFFGTDRDGPEDLDSYHDYFSFDDAHRYVGEATVTYYREPDVAAQIKSYNPNAKLLAIVRDPVQRMRSHFQYHKQLGILDEKKPLAEVLDDRSLPYIANSHYEETLPHFADRFGPDQFKIVSLEEGRNDPAALWSDLLSFLELPSIPCPDPDAQPENPTGSATFRWIYRTAVQPIKDHAPALHEWMLQSTLVRQTKLGLIRLLGAAEKEPIPPHVQEKLQREFAPTYEYLQERGFQSYASD